MKPFCAHLSRVFSSLLLFQAGVAHAAASHGFTAILTTDAENRQGAHIMVDAGEMTIEDVPALFADLVGEDGKSVLPAPSEAIEVIIVVPKGAPAAEREQFIAQIKGEITKQYPNAKYVIHESFVDLEQDDENLRTYGKAFADMTPAIAPGTPEARVQKKALDEVDRQLEENQELRRSWDMPTWDQQINRFQELMADQASQIGQRIPDLVGRINSRVNQTHPYNAVIAARIIAATKFFISSSVTIGKYGTNVGSAIIAAISGGISATFGYKARDWSNWCVQHQCPWFKDSPVVGWYNRHGWFKSALINFLKGTFFDYCLWGLAYVTHQTQNGVPIASPNSGEFFSFASIFTLVEIVTDGMGDDGARALELKGIQNYQTRSYMVWLIGLLGTTYHAFFRSGSIKMAAVFWSAMVASQLTVWSTGKFLRARAKRFVFISNQVQKEKVGELDVGSNWWRYILKMPGAIKQAIQNRRDGQFSISDYKMVEQHHSLDEAWRLELSGKDLAKIESDPDLSMDKMVEILNLKDADRGVVRKIWDMRKEMLGQPGFNLRQICARALTGT